MESAPSMKWNSGTKTTIRKTLGESSKKKSKSSKKSKQMEKATIASQSANGDKLKETSQSDSTSEPTLDEQAKHLLERFQGKIQSGSDNSSGGVNADANKTSSKSRRNRKKDKTMDSNDQEMIDAPPMSDVQDQSGHAQNGKGYNSGEDDMLMTYSRSDVVPGSNQPDQNGAAGGVVLGHSAALGQQQPPTDGQGQANSSMLSENDKKLQQRYFAVMTLSDANGISGLETMPVRCLCCGVAGHGQDDCPELNCKWCGEIGQHFSSTCKNAVKDIPEDGELSDCPICGETGHKKKACDMIWRTFNPATTEVRRVKKLPMSCYNCGSNLHYGMECKLKLTKTHGRSIVKTFSMANASQYIDETSTGQAISLLASKYPQGPLRRREPNGKDQEEWQSEDDPEGFIRPKVARDDGQGFQIRGKGRRNKREKRSDPKPQETSIDTYPPPRSAHGPGSSFNDMGERSAQESSLSFRGNDGRSRQDSYNPQHGGDSWRPPLPAGPPPTGHFQQTREPRQGGHDRYQPMPSAGRNAWKKHRT
ncbi:MAG: hypothetical protein M1823_005697 [Watsoniomyces obsoletus]|nr:MAG: hypothetical protein M1823_005697 [Watsoniomyces obsoletus]